MDAQDRRRLTDAVTLSRVPIAVAMVACRRHRRVVAATFLLGALTDVVDGPLARRLGTASERGARLDSAADAAFSAAAAAVAVGTIDRALRRSAGLGAAIVAATRLLALVVTRRRFGVWSAVHTRLNKATGACVGAVVAAALGRGRMPAAALQVAGAVAGIAALEELAIVATCDRYDPDRRWLLSS